MLALKIVILDNNSVTSTDLRFKIETGSRHQVTGVFKSFETARNHLHLLNPDMLFLDVRLPGINGIDAILPIKTLVPGCNILMYANIENEEFIISALKNGACGYLTKCSSADKIISSIEEAYGGGTPLSTEIVAAIVKSFQRGPVTPLTKREIELLEKISLGMSRKAIAGEMFISVETVKVHLRNIYFKLDVHSKAEAIKLARKKKII